MMIHLISFYIFHFLPGLRQPHRRGQSQGPSPELWAINPGLFEQTPTNMVSDAGAKLVPPKKWPYIRHMKPLCFTLLGYNSGQHIDSTHIRLRTMIST